MSRDLLAMIERLSERVRYLEEQLRLLPIHAGTANPANGIIIGKLNADLTHGGTAAFSVWNIDPTGGLDADTTRDRDIIDPEIIGTGMKLASGVVVIGARHQGAIVLIGYGTCPVEA